MLALFAALALAQAAPTPPAVTDPKWLRRPSAEDLARFYPDRAAKFGLEGQATISCHVTAQGELAGCSVAREFPVGEGFGEATIALARLFKMEPTAQDGRGTEGRPVRIPVRWMLPGTPIAKLARFEMAMACYGQVAHRAQQDPDADGAWQAIAYWSVMVASAASSGGMRPLAYEDALAKGHANAQAGAAPPKGADLEACLAQAKTAKP